jgi:hypothetical protein
MAGLQGACFERYKNLSATFVMPAAILDRVFAVADELAPKIVASAMAWRRTLFPPAVRPRA